MVSRHSRRSSFLLTSGGIGGQAGAVASDARVRARGGGAAGQTGFITLGRLLITSQQGHTFDHVRRNNFPCF